MTKQELDYANDCITQAAKLLADSYVADAAEMINSKPLLQEIYLRLDDFSDRLETFDSDNPPKQEHRDKPNPMMRDDDFSV